MTDLTPDFIYESKGRITEEGYEIESAVPFKTLRFPPDATQRWAINVTRGLQSSGREDGWTPARRAQSSFLAQPGQLDGLTDLRRGLVLDLNPVVATKADGSASSWSWRYEPGRPEFGANLRWGVTIARVQRDVGGASKVGLVYAARSDGDDSNQVAAADARLVFGSIYSVQLQGGRQPDARGRTRHDRADLAGDLQPRPPPRRAPLPGHRHPRQLPRRQRLHQPRRDRPRESQPPRLAVRRARRVRPELDHRRAARWHLAVPARHDRRAVAREDTALQQHGEAEERLGRRRIRALRVVRVRSRAVRRLHDRGRRSYRSLHGDAVPPQPRLGRHAGHAAVPELGEYDARRQDALRDGSRSELPLLIRDPVSNAYVPAVAVDRNALRVDWLFSYQPTPGTVFFAGYGSSLTEPRGLELRHLLRTADGFFVKLSYPFRM